MGQAKKTDAPGVLKAALKLLEKHGHEALSLRAVARSLDVSAPSLAHYYAGKAALERAMVEEGNRMLHEELRVAMRWKKPKPAFAAMAIAYVTFARERPLLYRFMMDGRGDRPAADSGNALWKLVLGAVGQVSGMPQDVSMAAATWSFLHGFALLEQAGRFGEAGPENGFEVGLEALFVSFEAAAQRKTVRAMSEYLGFH